MKKFSIIILTTLLALSQTIPASASQDWSTYLTSKELRTTLFTTAFVGATCYILKDPVSKLFHYLFINDPHETVIEQSTLFAEQIREQFNIITPYKPEHLKQLLSTAVSIEINRLINNAPSHVISDDEQKEELHLSINYCKYHPYITANTVIKKYQTEVIGYIAWLYKNLQRLTNSSKKISAENYTQLTEQYHAAIDGLQEIELFFDDVQDELIHSQEMILERLNTLDGIRL